MTKKEAEIAAIAVVRKLPKGKWKTIVDGPEQFTGNYNFCITNDLLWIYPLNEKFYVILRNVVTSLDFPDTNSYTSPVTAMQKSLQALEKKIKQLEKYAGKIKKSLEKQ